MIHCRPNGVCSCLISQSTTLNTFKGHGAGNYFINITRSVQKELIKMGHFFRSSQIKPLHSSSKAELISLTSSVIISIWQENERQLGFSNQLLSCKTRSLRGCAALFAIPIHLMSEIKYIFKIKWFCKQVLLKGTNIFRARFTFMDLLTSVIYSLKRFNQINSPPKNSYLHLCCSKTARLSLFCGTHSFYIQLKVNEILCYLYPNVLPKRFPFNAL